MTTKKKVEIITRTMNNLLSGLKISRELDMNAAEQVNPYDFEEGERKFAADAVSAMYNEAMRTAMIVAADMVRNCAQEQGTI